MLFFTSESLFHSRKTSKSLENRFSISRVFLPHGHLLPHLFHYKVISFLPHFSFTRFSSAFSFAKFSFFRVFLQRSHLLTHFSITKIPFAACPTFPLHSNPMRYAPLFHYSVTFCLTFSIKKSPLAPFFHYIVTLQYAPLFHYIVTFCPTFSIRKSHYSMSHFFIT